MKDRSPKGIGILAQTGERRTIDSHIEDLARLDDVEQLINVCKDIHEHGLFRNLSFSATRNTLAEHHRAENRSHMLTYLEICISRVAVGAIVDDPVHIKVQIICIHFGTQFG